MQIRNHTGLQELFLMDLLIKKYEYKCNPLLQVSNIDYIDPKTNSKPFANIPDNDERLSFIFNPLSTSKKMYILYQWGQIDHSHDFYFRVVFAVLFFNFCLHSP